MIRLDHGTRYFISPIRDVPGVRDGVGFFQAVFAVFRNYRRPVFGEEPGWFLQLDVFTKSQGFVGVEAVDPVLGENCWHTRAEADACLTSALVAV